MSITEKVQLLGAGTYKNIPDELTLSALPTASELDYVSSEEFDQTMVSKILPQAVEENINFGDLLQVDYEWVCRCLRFLNYGPYHTVNAIYCDDCGQTSRGEYSVDLRSVECKPLPTNFKNELVIKKEEFLDFDGNIKFHLPTIQEVINSHKDKAFQDPKGNTDAALARMCYMITAMGNVSGLTPIEVKMKIQNDLSPADYIILKRRIGELTDYGLRAGGTTTCPKCGSKEAIYMTLVGDRYFRPTVANLREWKHDRDTRRDEDISGDASENV